MKKIPAFIIMLSALLVLFGGCKNADVTVTVSPTAAVVSESPAITSPSADVSPEASAEASPLASPQESLAGMNGT